MTRGKGLQFLRLRRRTWFFQIAVPLKLVPMIGKKRIEESCGTDSIEKAKIYRDTRLAQLRQTWRVMLGKDVISEAALARLRHGTFIDRQQSFGDVFTSRDERQQDYLVEAGAPDEAVSAMVSDMLLSLGVAPSPENIAKATPTYRKAVTAAWQFDATKDRIPDAPVIHTPLEGEFLKDGEHAGKGKLLVAWLSAPVRRKRKKAKSANTWKEGQRALKSLGDYLVKHNLPRTLEAVTPMVAHGFLASLKTEKRSASTANKVKNLCGSYFRYLMFPPMKLIRENPFAGLNLPEEAKEPRLAFTPDEMVKVFDRLENNDPETLLASAVALLTGARRGDVMALAPSVIDLKEGTTRFMGAKTSTPYVVPIHKLLLPILAKLCKGKEADEPIIPGEGPHIGKDFKAACVELFGEDTKLTFHCWRHTLSTLLENSGCPELTMNRIIGHKPGDSETVRTYSKGDLDYMREQLHKIKLPVPVVAALKRLAK